MRAWLGASLLFLSFQFFSIDSNEGENDPSRRRHLSVEDVNSLLVTEANNMYGKHQKGSSDKSWSDAVDDEWSRARELEKSAKDNVRALRRTTVANGTFPYVVCDLEPGKSGERSRATVEDHFGPHLVVSCSASCSPRGSC